MMSVLSDLENVIRGFVGLVDETIVVARVVRWSMMRFANNEPTIINNWITGEATAHPTKSRRCTTAFISSTRTGDLGVGSLWYNIEAY